MNGEQVLAPMITGAASLCAVMAVVNGLRFRSRGMAAFAMSIAFLALGAGLLAYRSGASQTILIGCGVIVFAALATDFYLRAPVGQRK